MVPCLQQRPIVHYNVHSCGNRLSFDENKLIHQYNTRQKDDFYAHTVQSEIGQRSIKFKGCRLWNNLPTEIKVIQSFSCFKYNLKNYLLQCLD